MRSTAKVKKNGENLWECLLCTTMVQKMRGLMFRRRPIPLLFIAKVESRAPIHSFFCPRFDAIFLDSGKIVVDIKQNIAPWNLRILPSETAKFLIELPPGEAFKVQKGQKLDFLGTN
jgi:uncharacterized membrane protein (UPF0127 family)